MFDDKTLTIIAGDQKPIKVVNEGQALIIPGNPFERKDLTQEYFCAQKYGVGLVMAANAGVGVYKVTAWS